MHDEQSDYDYDRLRDYLEDDSMAAFFAGGFGGALFDAYDIKKASEDELLVIARKQGVNLNKFLL